MALCRKRPLTVSSAMEGSLGFSFRRESASFGALIILIMEGKEGRKEGRKREGSLGSIPKASIVELRSFCFCLLFQSLLLGNAIGFCFGKALKLPIVGKGKESHQGKGRKGKGSFALPWKQERKEESSAPLLYRHDQTNRSF